MKSIYIHTIPDYGLPANKKGFHSGRVKAIHKKSAV